MFFGSFWNGVVLVERFVVLSGVKCVCLNCIVVVWW